MYKLNAEERNIVEMISQFADKEIRPLVREYEEADKFPQEIIDKMKDLGFFGLKVPVEYGGSGISNMAYANVLRN